METKKKQLSLFARSLSIKLLTQHHRVLAHDSHGQGALPDGLERVFDLEPAGGVDNRERERKKERSREEVSDGKKT